MSILNHYLDYHFAPGKFLIFSWKVFTGVTNYTHDEVDDSRRNWRIIVVQSECNTEFTYQVLASILDDKKK